MLTELITTNLFYLLKCKKIKCDKFNKVSIELSTAILRKRFAKMVITKCAVQTACRQELNKS